MQRKDNPTYCYNRAGHWETKSLKAASKGDYNKAGEYRTRSLQWLNRGKRAAEERLTDLTTCK